MSSRYHVEKTTEEREGYLPEQFLNTDKRCPILGEKFQKGHLLVRKRSKHQDLRQEWIG